MALEPEISSVGDLEVMYFNSISDLIRYLDDRIKILGDSLSIVENNIRQIEPRLTAYQALIDVIKKLVGSENVIATPAIEITGLKIVIDPKPVDEYDVLRESVDAMRDKLNVLKRVRDLLSTIASSTNISTPVLVQFRAGVPVKVLLGVSR